MAIRKRLLELARRVVGNGPVKPSSPAPQRAAVVPEPVAATGPALPPLEVEDPLPDSLLLDIREPTELAGGVAEGARLLPMDCVPHQVHTLDRAVPITVYCAAGARSLGVAHWLREQGFVAVSLESGIQALRWAKAPMRTPDRAGQVVTLTPTARLDGVLIGDGHVERLDGDLVRVVDATGLQISGRLTA